MDYSDLRPGAVFMYENNPCVVITSEFHRMQMRKAVMRATVRNLLTGQLLQKTFTASDRFDPAPVEKLTAQYLYRDGDDYHFMDKETFEQYHASQEVLGDKVKYLTEEMSLTLLLYNNNPIQIELPKTVTIKVTDAPNAIKGDSVSNTFKTVTCENNVVVSCPLFVQTGDLIRIDTETGKYLERAK